MLKRGLFIDRRGREHTIHIMEASSNYSRIDICREGTIFHTDPDGVEFSQVKKNKKTMVYGDPELHKEMIELMNKLNFSKLESNVSNEWSKEGKFIMKQTRGTDNKFFSELVQVNGRTDSETYVDGEQVLAIHVVSHDLSTVLDPMNKDEYETIELESTVVTSASPYVPAALLKTRFNLSWLKEVDYRVVKDVGQARELLKKLFDAKALIGIDTETDSLEFNLFSTGKMVGFIISPERGVSWYFPFAHKKFENLPMEFLQEIEDACNNASQDLVAHNKKFEMKVFKKVGLNINIARDSYLTSVLTNPTLGRGIHSLKNLMSEISGEKYLEFEDIFLDNKNINFADLDEETVRIYACPDADNTPKVEEAKYKELPVYTREILKLETELADLKADQEYWGFRIDTQKFMEGSETCSYVISMLEKMIYAVTRTQFKISSNDQLGDLLYNRMKCPVYVRTKTQKPSTGAKALKKLANENRAEAFEIVTSDIRDNKGNLIIKKEKLNNSKYPVVVLLEKYREYTKLQTAFYNRIEKGSVGTRYFFWINQNGAESGRQSSPMHQLPKEIKEDIIADSEHHSIYDSDYSQIELRLIFSLAGETVLIELCKDPDNDIHRAIGSGINGTEVWQISAAMRQNDKARNFGVVYLISGKGLAGQMHGAGATKEQEKECEDSLNSFFSTYKRIAKYIKDNKKRIEKEGQMRTQFGRTRYFEKIYDPDLPADKKQTLIRQGNNHPVQGTAADIMKIAEVNMNRYIKQKGWDQLVETPQGWFPLVRVMISAHDEAVTSAHYSIAPEEIYLMTKSCMELAIKGTNDEGEPIEFAPLFTSTAVIDNWKEGKDDQFQIPYRLRDRMIEDYLKTGKSAVDAKLIPVEGTNKVKPNLKEEMLRIINKYRDEELVQYMEDIISEVGEDQQAIADKVRHPSLTHELISRFRQTKDHEKEFGKLGHMDSIFYATGRYLDFRAGEDFAAPEEPSSDSTQDDEAKDYFEQITGLSEELTFVDDKGEIHYIGAEEQEEDGLWYDDEIDHIQAVTSGEVIRYWELFDIICVSTKGLTMQDCDDLLKLLFKYKDPKGFFRVQLHHGEKMIDTGIRAERVDKKEILDFLESRAPLSLV